MEGITIQDGTLVRVTRMTEGLSDITDIRLLSKFFSDFTDFVNTIKEFCKEYDLLYEAEPRKILDLTEITFFTNEHNPKIFGEMEVQVCINNSVVSNELNKMI